MTDPAAEYLVQYGASAFLGRFRAAAGGAFARGQRVVVRSERGLERGEVLGPAGTTTPQAVGPTGELLRAATGEDDVTDARLRELGQRLFGAAERLAGESGLPLAVLDVEVLLDGQQAVLHALHWGECDTTPVFERLSAEFGLTVKLHDLTRPAAAAPEPAGCGAEGCGGGGCGSGGCGTSGGCSSGSCSRGKIKNADDLTEYFAGLRKQMEAANTARTPLL
jgi:hypothetical protein